MPAQSRRGSKWKVVPFLGLALLFHQILIALGIFVYLHYPTTELQEPIDVSLIDEPSQGLALSPSEMAEAERSQHAQPVEPEEEKAKPEKPPENESTKAPGQVVDLPKPAKEQVPKDAKYASEWNTTAEHETKARSTGPTDAPAGPKGPTVEPEVTEPPRPEPSKKVARGEPAPEQLPNTRASKPARPRSDESQALEHAPDGTFPGAPPSVPAEPNGSRDNPSAPGRHLTLRDLIPTDRELQRGMSGGGGGGTNDYLKDVDEGESTALSSKKWKFASFFNRVKRTVAEHWKPGVEYRRRDPTGNVYGLRDRITVLRVALKPDGTVARVLVEQPSGVDFLDDEAITAFEQAQPFPNPPRQLVDERGMIEFRFAFIFEISSTPTFKVFRYN